MRDTTMTEARETVIAVRNLHIRFPVNGGAETVKAVDGVDGARVGTPRGRQALLRLVLWTSYRIAPEWSCWRRYLKKREGRSRRPTPATAKEVGQCSAPAPDRQL